MSPDSGNTSADNTAVIDSATENKAELSRLDELLRYYPLPSWRAFAWPVMMMVGLFLAW